jgi:pimeloyl-ACP methyl ester carboxylesterase
MIENPGQLACAGYVAYAKRSTENPISLAFAEMQTGLAEMKSLAATQLDEGCMAIMGYSRGGLLGLSMTEVHTTEFDAAILMASAPRTGAWTPGGGETTTMGAFLLDIDLIAETTAFLVMVAANDGPHGNNPHNDLLDLSTTLQVAVSGTVNTARLELRPAWESEFELGGRMLFQGEAGNGQPLLDAEGYYWRELLAHLETHLAQPPGINMLDEVSVLMLAAMLGSVGLWLGTKLRDTRRTS